MTSMIAPLLLVMLASQPPSPSPAVASQTQQQQTKSPSPATNKSQPATGAAPTATPAVLPVSTSGPSQNATAQNNQPANNWWALSLNDVITALLTFAIGVIALLQYKRMGISEAHTHTVERAYVTMSHHPPGLESPGALYSLNNVAHRDIQVAVSIKNLGNTPANVTNALVQLIPTDLPLPEYPAYDHSAVRRVWVSCVKGDDFTIFHNFPFSLEGWENLQKRKSSVKLYVIGYADYIDRFGCRHRCGYGRWYNPEIDDLARYEDNATGINTHGWNTRNNLLFVTQPNYNYDRERKKGEGDDWDNPAE